MNLVFKRFYPQAILEEYKGNYGIVVVSLDSTYDDAIGKFIPNLNEGDYVPLDKIKGGLYKRLIIKSCMERKSRTT